MTGFEPALRTPWMFRRLPIGLHGHEKWWIQWDSNSHYTAPQAVDSANWSMDPLRRHDSFFTIPQTSPRILDLHQKRLLRLLGKLLLVNWGDLEMVPVLQLSTLLPLQRSGLLLCCQRFELSCLSTQPPQGCVYTSSTTDAGRQGRTRTYVVSNVRDLQSRAFATQLHLTIKIKDVLACVCSLKVISNQTMPLNQFHNYSSIRIQTDHAIYFIMLHCYFIAVFCYV